MKRKPITREVGKAVRRSNEPTRVLMERYDLTTVQIWRARGRDPNRRRTYDDGLLIGAQKSDAARTEADQLAKALEWSLSLHDISLYRGNHDYHSAIAVLAKYRKTNDE